MTESEWGACTRIEKNPLRFKLAQTPQTADMGVAPATPETGFQETKLALRNQHRVQGFVKRNSKDVIRQSDE